jgi:hypothetical protein
MPESLHTTNRQQAIQIVTRYFSNGGESTRYSELDRLKRQIVPQDNCW